MMAGGISIHAVDVAAGRPAHGPRVEIWRLTPGRTQLVNGRLGVDGRLQETIVTGEGIVAGDSEVLFHFDRFYRDFWPNRTGFFDQPAIPHREPWDRRAFPSAVENHPFGLFAVLRGVEGAADVRSDAWLPAEWNFTPLGREILRSSFRDGP
jgi:5-hydroxyisourate hydrolase-like protein (transthyretin family)